ncbi:MAG TPA: BatA domain-containing protein, partial [Gemmatimonadaceae bacterium]|nr:BatA domain-containing protein [Gemmatimonadaceae bacterium]
MTFLAPWAMLAGVLGAAGLVVLHLVARQRPAAYPLPTARFVPDRRTLVSRISQRPHDLLLLALRVLLVLSAAAAFARPVLTSRRSARARVLVLDRSSVVADAGDALRRAREVSVDGATTRLVIMDSTATTLAGGTAVLDSIARVSVVRCCTVGSLSAALVAARRAASELGARADSVELVILSPLVERQWD